MTQKTRNTISLVAALLIALVLIPAGITKLLGMDFQIKMIESWGYPLWSRFPIGLTNLLMGITILITKYRNRVAFLFFPWAVVAAYTHLQATPSQIPQIGTPIIVAVLATIIIYSSRKKIEIK